MKTCCNLALIVLLSGIAGAVSAAEPIHLGTVTSRHGILLLNNTQGTNWECFRIELTSHSLSNIVRIRTTNSVLTLSDLAHVPEGRATMKLRSVCHSNVVSEVSNFTIDIRRAVPIPGAMIFQLPPTQSTPPMPMRQIPGGTNASYSDEMNEFYQRSRRDGK